MANPALHSALNVDTSNHSNNMNYQHTQRPDTVKPASFLPNAPPGLVSEINVSVARDFHSRFEQLKVAEQDKNQLIEDLIRQYYQLEQHYLIASADLEREKEYNRQYQQDKKANLELMKKIDFSVKRAPFVVCLIDGDGILFRNDLLRDGDAGGRTAADLFTKAIKAQCDELDIPDDVKIVARIYANINELDRVCHQAGIFSDKDYHLSQFTNGFTSSKYLFDFINVASGKDRADVKLIETFKLYLDDCHCRHIFFGGSHDNGYARFLEDLDSSYLTKVTLLEGPPFAKELKALPHNKLKLGDLFRDELIKVPKKGADLSSQAPSTLQQPLKSLTINGINDKKSIMSNSEDYDESEVDMGSKTLTASPQSRKGSQSDSSQRKLTTTPDPVRASTVRKAAPTGRYNDSAEEFSAQYASESIPRNRNGQRLDPAFSHFKKEDVKRVRAMKICNYKCILGKCPYEGVSCEHDHDKRLPPYEVKIVKQLTRMMACRNGSYCDDPICIYGHHCEAPPGNRGQYCLFGDDCRFTEEMHFTDRQPVKMYKV